MSGRGDDEELPEKRELRAGRYLLIGSLGEGGQGKTFEAEDRGIAPGPHGPAKLADSWERYVAREKTKSGADPKKNAESTAGGATTARRVAIKCFRLNKAKAWKDVELAEREARTLASLDHPSLPKYIEHFEEDGALYLVMEKIEGESLATLRQRRAGASLSPAEVIKMLEGVADALRYLHGGSTSGNIVVHRDIKPGNVIRRPDGSYALVDFGAVRDRLKQGGSTVVGTFGYMAPEQFQGRASPKSDLYGLAATALAMLTGTEPEDLPHEGLGIDVGGAVPGGTPKPLVRALTAMLIPDPDRRVNSIDEALAFLKRERLPDQGGGEEPSSRERRKQKQDAKRAAKEDRRRERALARSRQPPFIPRLFAQLGLAVAILATWIVLGLAAPILFGVLSLIFGAKLRRIGAASAQTAKRATRRLTAASRWLSGHRIAVDSVSAKEEEATTSADPKIRVRTELDDVKSVTEPQAQALAIRERARAKNAGHEIVDDEMEAAAREEIEAERQRLLKKRLPSAPPPASVEKSRRS